MKKIYLSILSLFALSTVFAQVADNTSKRNDERVKPMVTVSNASKVIANPTASNRVTYLTEDFEATTFPPTGWSKYSGPGSTVTDPNQEWHHQAVGGYPQNADPFQGTNPGGCAAINYINSVDQHDEWLMTPAVALPMNACRVAFDFGTSAYWHCAPPMGNTDNADIQVLVSTDGGTTWSSALWQEDSTALLAASYSDGWDNLPAYNWSRAFVDLSAYQGMSVNIAWFYYGLDGAPYYLDNVSVEDVPDNEIAIQKAWAGDIVLDWDYSMIPTAQTKLMRVGTVIRNLGGLSQTFDVTCDVNDGTTSVYNNTQTITQTPAQIDTLWWDTGYTPTALNTYEVTFALSADSDLSNNNDTATVETTQYIYAHDFTVDGIYRFDVDDQVAMGNLFVAEASATLMGADIKFETGTDVDLYVAVQVWEVGTSIQDLTFVGLQDYTVPASVIGSGNFVTIPFGSSINLTAGKSYVLEVQKVNAGTERMYLGGSDEGDDDFSTVCYGPFGTGGAVNWYNGWGFSPAVRMNFDPSLSVDNLDALAGVSVYPNPSNGVITVTNDEHTANTIEVLNVAGAVVYTTEANATKQIDLSANGAGVYFVKVSNETGSFSERVVIK